MRIFCCSDIHIDYSENARWVDGLSKSEYQDDVLILPGDITHNLEKLKACFTAFAERFSHVFFVPGNHDLWLDRHSSRCSLEKFHQVIDLAVEHGLTVKPSLIGDYYFVPVYSWYDYSFGEPSDFLLSAWMDFRRCQWPEYLHQPSVISDHFLSMNKDKKMDLPAHVRQISFSHFLPRIDLMPSRIPEEKRSVYPVLGSDKIDQHIRKLGTDIHVYGHSHVNRSVFIDEVAYINNAFGYPREAHIARKRLVDVLEEVAGLIDGIY